MRLIKTKIARILLSAFMLAALVVPVIQSTPALATAWYDENWHYRKSFTVSNAAANYQTKVLIGETSGATGEDVDLGGFAQTDFDDIRFTGADGVTKLPYWVETITGTTPNQLATVWVKNNATPDTTLYIYYGNPSVSSESSGYNTFAYFDDFGGVNWSYDTGVGNPAEHSIIQNNILYQVSGGDGIFMLNPSDGSLINQWLAGTEVWCAPVIIGDYIYAWSFDGVNGKLYKVNQNDGTSSNVSGGAIDFESLTKITTSTGVDALIIPKGGYITAVKASDLSTLWTSAVPSTAASYSYWDGGLVVGNYLYTRYSVPGTYKVYKLNIDDGTTADYANLGSYTYYSVMIYDADMDQILLTEMLTGKAVALDAQTLDTNWTYTIEETPGNAAGQYYFMYNGAYHNGVWYVGTKKTGGGGGYVYAINAATGAKIWKNSTAETNTSTPTNMVVSDQYLFVPTHDYIDSSYKKLMVIDLTNGVLYDTLDQSGNSACCSPLVWAGKIFIGMWDTHEVNARVLGSGQAVNNPYKMDSYHTGYISTALTDYNPDKSPEGDDLSAWTITGSSSVTVSAGKMIVDSVVGVDDAKAYTTATYGNTYAVRSRLKTAHSNEQVAVEAEIFAVYASQYGGHMMFDYSGATYPGKAGNYDGSWSGLSSLTGWAANTYATTDIIRNGATSIIYKINDSTVGTITTNLVSTAANLEYRAWTADHSALTTVDWIAIRSYTATEPTFGSWSAASSPSVPAVTTGAAAGIYSTGATLQGTLTDLAGFTPVYVFFQYGISTAYGATTVEQTMTAVGGASQAITGLTTGQVYHFRVVARYNGLNYIYGADSFFTPSGGAGGTPVVTTGSAVNLASTTATLQGTLDSLASYSPVYCYFEYGTTAGYGSATIEQTFTAATGFSANLTGLSPETQYHFRARVRYNTSTYVSGTDVTFTTTAGAAPPPTPGGTSNPDILRIDDVKVFSGYEVSADKIFVASVAVVYNGGTPAGAVSEYFSLQIIVGTQIKAQTPVKVWGYSPESVYLAGTSSAAVPWGATNVTVRLTGNADKFTVVPYNDRVLTSGDWIGSDLLQLDEWVIGTAKSLQANNQTTYVISSSGADVLSESGGALFSTGIPDLMKVRPNLFNIISGHPVTSVTPIPNNMQGQYNVQGALGPYLGGILDTWGKTNIDPNMSASTTWLIFVVVGFAAFSIILGVTIGFALGIGVSCIILIIGMVTGAIPVMILWAVLAIFIYGIGKKHYQV